MSDVLATAGEAGIDGIRPDIAGPLRMDEARAGAARVEYAVPFEVIAL